MKHEKAKEEKAIAVEGFDKKLNEIDNKDKND
jgi:hypothetical protein